MDFSGCIWKRTTVDAMIAEFVKAERDKLRPISPALIDAPNLNDARDNGVRRLVLWERRGPLLDRIPADTKWHEVSPITAAHLDALHHINSSDWTAPGIDFNEVLSVAKRRPTAPLRGQPGDWPLPILWGHSKSGPLSILEGNNRFADYVATNPRPTMSITAIVGLSPSPCIWHILDCIQR